MLTIKFSSESLEDLAQALAEGEHAYGHEFTMAGYSLIMWPSVTQYLVVPDGCELDAEDRP
jgi:hypothetical protein